MYIDICVYYKHIHKSLSVMMTALNKQSSVTRDLNILQKLQTFRVSGMQKQIKDLPINTKKQAYILYVLNCEGYWLEELTITDLKAFIHT